MKTVFRPKYITFDCYGTLTRFRMAEMARELFAGRIPPERMEDFVKDFAAFRLDEVLGAWKPYPEVVRNSVRRTCKLWKIDYRDEDGDSIVRAVPTWGPHPDVPEPLAKVASEFPLVILSNAANTQIMSNVDKLGAKFHAVYTAEQAQAYKPRFQAFEYLLDRLGCAPGDLLHVSSSLRYDLMTAHDMRITNKVFVNRGHDAPNPSYGYAEISDLSGLPALVGL